jgi:hypothetical protein
MGPRVDGPDLETFVLRPFHSSTTYGNLRACGEGVFHVTDDVLLIARTVIGQEIDVPTRPAERVRGAILTGACRYAEFRVTNLDDREERAAFTVEAVARGRLRDFFGFNRAKHAVIEAAILASRTALLPLDEIVEQLNRLHPLVAKTGGPDEHTAFELVRDYVHRSAACANTGAQDTAR